MPLIFSDLHRISEQDLPHDAFGFGLVHVGEPLRFRQQIIKPFQIQSCRL